MSNHDWRRVHPLTPVMRSWRTVTTLLAIITLRSESAIRSLFEDLTGTHHEGNQHAHPIHVSTTEALIALGVLIGALALLLFLNWISWRATSFRVTEQEVEVRQGVLKKSHRNARLDRVQAIDVEQPLVPRLFGLAVLSFDVAGSGSASLRISMLKRHEAEDLRAAMLEHIRVTPSEHGQRDDAPAGLSTTGVSTASHDVDQHAAGAPSSPDALEESAKSVHASPSRPRTVGTQLIEKLAREGRFVGDDLTETLNSTFAAYGTHPGLGEHGRIVHVPPHRILAASALRFGALFGFAWAIFGVGALVVGVATGNASAGWGIAFTTLFTAVTILSSIVQSALRQANFSAALTSDGLLITQGVTSTERRLIPLDRIQAVGLEQPLLWRPFGWWRAHFNIAAHTASLEKREPNILLPAGSIDDALTMLALALPLRPDGERDTDITADLLRDATSSQPANLRRQPTSSRWLDPFTWRRNGWTRTASLTLIRHGWLKRHVELIPLARVQSLALTSGPLQRNLGLVSLALHSTEGPISATISHQASGDGEALLLDFAAVTGEARRQEQARTASTTSL